MDTLLKLEINSVERELLLEGLRFVRRARQLTFREAEDLTYPNFQNDLHTVAELFERLQGTVDDTEAAVEAPGKPR